MTDHQHHPEVPPDVLPDVPPLRLPIRDEFEARYWARILGMSKRQVRALFGTRAVQADGGHDPASPCSIAPLLQHPAPSAD